MSDGEDLTNFGPNGQPDVDESRSDYRARVEAALEGVATEPMPGGLALDLVTRQLLFIREQVAPDLEAYYEAESFDLATYGPHPFLPVALDDAVFECVYVSEVSVQGLDDWGSTKTYDFPAGRLAHVPAEMAWTGAEVDDV
jgi:hypothetical protein